MARAARWLLRPTLPGPLRWLQRRIRAAQKQAIRDGVADFLVNSLDEALRILKNQLRKRETVAVCVGLAPADVEREMKERGVAARSAAPRLRIAPFHEALLLQRRRRRRLFRKTLL